MSCISYFIFKIIISPDQILIVSIQYIRKKKHMIDFIRKKYSIICCGYHVPYYIILFQIHTCSASMFPTRIHTLPENIFHSISQHQSATTTSLSFPQDTKVHSFFVLSPRFTNWVILWLWIIGFHFELHHTPKTLTFNPKPGNKIK